MDVEIRILKTVEEIEKINMVEKEVWNLPPLPIHQTITVAKNGGIILGAFLKDRLIGYLYSFPGFREKAYLCSHMLAILPPYQQQGIGEKMKRKQRELAKQLGYEMITWTFDPLESKNAYFNLHKLGAIGVNYEENYYGYLNDNINKGLPTDRMIIEWNVNEEKEKRKIDMNENNVLLTRDESGNPFIHDHFELLPSQRYFFVAIPKNFQEIKKEDRKLAQSWRFATRKVFQKLCSSGFVAIDLVSYDEHSSFYLFSKRRI